MSKKEAITYQQSGVSIEANDEMVDLISENVKRTYSPRVMHLHNGFAGLFRLDNDAKFKRNYKNPVLVACTDGVGTKIKIAAMMKKYDTVGIDLVAMSINDLIVQGAEPLFFLDYVAVNKLIPSLINQFVKGIADGCVMSDCSLIGGETAEMPAIYEEGEFDLAGFAVGVIEKDNLPTPDSINDGDAIIGLASSGVHSNGYALVRRICFDREKLQCSDYIDELGETLGEALLRPTKIYAKSVLAMIDKYPLNKVVKAMAHITGGGLVGNIPRVLGGKFDAYLDSSKWEVPAIFKYMRKAGPVELEEMYRVFNMGIGYVIVVKPSEAAGIIDLLKANGETASLIGQIKSGNGKVVIS